VPGGDLDVAQVDAGVGHGCDEGVPEHMRMCPGEPDSGCSGEPPEPPGGGVPVHPRAAAVEQHRPRVAAADGAVDGSGDRRGQRDQDDLAAFAAGPQDPVAVFLARMPVSALVASMIRRPSSPSMATKAKSFAI
jgi:hypothetical protein